MAKTPCTAAVRWLGMRFDVAMDADNLPTILVHALGAGSIAFDGENLGVTTGGGPVNIGPGDWLIETEDGLGAVTAADFEANYEVISE